VEALRAHVYRSEHVGFLRRRGEWFLELDAPPLVLWWVAAGHRPTLGEAKKRLDLLVASGPTPAAFTFSRAFGPDGLPLLKARAD
jgi:Domain of unknown function (DUF3291)